ncbi:MAG: hypothetical protein R3B70_28765 [Polyangiaceae bacterium]
MPKKKELLSTADAALVAKAEALVCARGAVPRNKLPDWSKLAPVAQSQLVEALVARGLEVGEKGALRLPLRRQVLSMTEAGARVAWKQAPKRVLGAAPAERAEALALALSSGDLRAVVRTKVDTLVGAKEDVLAPAEVEALVKAHEALGAVLKLVRKKLAPKGPLARVQKTLLRDDLAQLVAPFAPHAAARRPSGDSDADRVLRRVREMEQPPVLLVWIPDLVKSLAPHMPSERALSALLDLRRRGIVDLRLESGVGRLSPEDAALCPRNADGYPLSNALRLEGR